MWKHLATTALLAGALALTAQPSRADSSADENVTVTRLSGTNLSARRLITFRDGNLVVESAGKPVEVALTDLIDVSTGVAPDAVTRPEPDDVALDLWSGEELRGRITGGDDRKLRLASALLGDLEIAIDEVAGVRFLARLAEVADPPDLRSRDDTDVVHLVGGDRVDCTLTALSAAQLTCSTESDDDLSVPYSKITAVRLMQSEPRKPAGTALVVVLRDGTRAIGGRPRIDGGRLRIDSIAGFEVAASLDDIVAAHALSTAFRYLSDLADPAVDVKPFWEPVAGDATQLYAPRRDRSFSGTPLRVGGRSWLKGVGVYSGTTLTYDLNGEYSQFRTHVGIDDHAGELGGVVFEVLVDGERRWQSGFVRAAGTDADGRGARGPLYAGVLDVTGAKTLTLRVLAGDDEDPYPIQDEADWLGAMVVR